MSLWSIFQEASLLNKLILLLLLTLSVFSWAVIIERWRYFRTAMRADRKLLNAVGKSWHPENVYDISCKAQKSPAAEVFVASSDSISKLHNSGAEEWNEAFDIEREQVKAAGERGLPFLAIIASASPFIGLLGTVWGVMIAFLKLGDLQGQPALELVGPGIAEALIATAAGLFAAIPATIAYNAFLAAQRNLMRRSDEFCRRFVMALATDKSSRLSSLSGKKKSGKGKSGEGTE